jgi:nucleoside 2-deoxyribosyltransferase
MPIGSDPRHRAKQKAIQNGAEAAGFRAEFPTYSVSNPRFDGSDYTRQLQQADAVLADLTGERPSCYFEVGFAEALGRPVFLLAEAGTDIHQTAFRHRVRFYEDLPQLESAVRTALSQAVAPTASAAE